MTPKSIEKLQNELQKMATANSKKFSTKVLKYLSRNMYLKISTGVDGYGITKMLQYIYYKDIKKIRRYNIINLDFNGNGFYRDYGNNKLKLRVSNPISSNIIKLSHLTYLFYSTVSDESGKKVSVEMYFIGLNRYLERQKFVQFINDYSRFLTNKNKDVINKKTSIRIREYGDTNSVGGERVPAKQYDDIVSRYKDDIKESLEKWESNKKWYDDHNLIHKYGLLLWGPPGTGKSSMSNFVATTMCRNIFIVDLSKKLEDIKKVKLDYSDITTNICVIEDVDLYLNLKDKSDEQKQDVENKINWLMQFLDGPGSINGMVTILTTNDKDALDPRILRKGRIDKQFEIGYFNLSEMEEMCNRFGVDIANIDLEGKETIQPVELQSKIMEYLFTELDSNI